MLVKTSTTILATLPMMRGRLRAELSLPKTGGADGLNVTLDDTGVGMDGLTVTLEVEAGVDMDGLTVTLEVEAGVGGELTVMDGDGVDVDKLTVTLDDTGVGMDGLTVTLEVEAGVGGKLTVMLDDDGVDGDKLTVILDVDWVIDGVDGVDTGRLLLALGATEVDAKLLVGADPALSEA